MTLSLPGGAKFARLARRTWRCGGILLVIVWSPLRPDRRSNLEAQGLTSGFAFLQRATGWGVSFSLIPFETSDTYLKVIWVGLLNSLFLGAISLTLATVIGTAIGIMRVSGNRMAELIGTTYVEIFRNLPMLLQVFFWYAILVSLPQPREAVSIADIAFLSSRGIYLPGLNVTGLSVFIAALTLVAAFGLRLWLSTGHVFRRMAQKRKTMFARAIWLGWLVLAIILLWSGRIPDTPLLSIAFLKASISAKHPCFAGASGMHCSDLNLRRRLYRRDRAARLQCRTERTERSRSRLGLTAWQIFSRIRLPLAVRSVMPTLTNQYVWLFKSTTIGIAVGFVDFLLRHFDLDQPSGSDRSN